jgi:hypothetical protein
MVKNKHRCAYRHCNSAIIDTVGTVPGPSIVSKSTPSRGVFGQIDSADIDTPSRVCHGHGSFLGLFLRKKEGENARASEFGLDGGVK